MKIKEKYHRILTAKAQWQKAISVTDYISSCACTKEIENYFFDKYANWEIGEEFHCCYGWEQCCWVDPYAEGIWDMTENDVAEMLKEIFRENRRLSLKMPIFYYYEHDNAIDILLTHRYLDSDNCVDYRISGERCSN